MKNKEEEEYEALEKNTLNANNETIAAGLDHNNNNQLNQGDNLVEEEQGIDNYYPPNLSKRQKELLSTYFMHLASLELNKGLYQKHQKVLDDLVDLAAEYAETHPNA